MPSQASLSIELLAGRAEAEPPTKAMSNYHSNDVYSVPATAQVPSGLEVVSHEDYSGLQAVNPGQQDASQFTSTYRHPSTSPSSTAYDELKAPGLQASLPGSNQQGTWHSQDQYDIAPEKATYSEHHTASESVWGSQTAYDTAPETHYAPTNAMSQYVATAAAGAQDAERARRRKRRIFCIGTTIFVVIVLGAVLGGVLGSRSARNSTSPSSNSTTSGASPTASGSGSTNTAAASPTSIKSNSRMTVSGYRNSRMTNFTQRLFFQGQDNVLRYVDKTSGGSGWSEPVVLDTLAYEPMTDGPLASIAMISGGVDNPFFSVFYLDKDSYIRQWFFDPDEGSLKGITGDMNGQPPIKAQKIAAHDPWIITQDLDDGLRVIYHSGSSPPFNNYTVNITATPGTGLVSLDSRQQQAGGGGFIYRGTDGKMATWLDPKIYAENVTASWLDATLSYEIPEKSPIGAFTVTRPYNAEDKVNTYVLYQDDHGVIQVVWQDSKAASWNGPQTFDALSNAAAGTDITCLSQIAWSAQSVSLSSQQDMNLCYFQEKDTNRVKEVWYNGKEWINNGYVSLP
ncbi:uncharacterized protein JN550_002800 [Neoarthrinium moseri]|uniref:uncharacterized protein n=1 Tax=Neoarthrinium moseri TaxID=1658444 RepID=UPI001FDBBC28|nr:uncharacterized protein JN550_002800 [Neoarthrinium moseri]KAI1874221.1 hypothetical protein JN550_002800 [Neoarthrinium moseri]